MENTPQGLSLTFSWNSRGIARRRVVPLGSALRVALAVSLSAGCYELGRWTSRVEDAQAAKPDDRVVIVERNAKPGPPEVKGTAAGGPVGAAEVITPLNARDPSSLVMAPFADAPPPAAAVPAPAAPSDEVPEAPAPHKVYRKVKDIKPDRRF